MSEDVDMELPQAKLALAFHDRMTKGQSYQGPNAYRERFYKEVIQLADEVSFHELPHVVRMTVFKVHARQSTNKYP